MSNDSDELGVTVTGVNGDEQSTWFSCASQIFNDHQLPSLQCSSKNISRKKPNVKAKVQTRFPRLNLKKHSIHIPYKIHDGFTINEKRIIKNALQVVERCLMNPENLRKMYHICGTSGCLLGENAWEHSLLETHQCHHDYHYLLPHQLMCLKVKNETNQFPTVNIYQFYEKTDVLGEGILSCVSCNSFESTVLIDGKFDVYLNRYHLGARGRNGTNAIYWGGVIVHEMLHNLGHDHGKNDMSNRWQINAFEECFVHNARYS